MACKYSFLLFIQIGFINTFVKPIMAFIGVGFHDCLIKIAVLPLQHDQLFFLSASAFFASVNSASILFLKYQCLCQ
jgi:hypothetical protein